MATGRVTADVDLSTDRPAILGTYHDIVFRMALVFTVTLPLMNAVTLPGIGTLSRATGIAFAAAGSIVYLAAGRRRRLDAAHLIGFVFLGWAALSIAWSIRPEASESILFTLLQVVAMFVLLWEFAPTAAHLVTMLRAYVIGAAITAGLLLQAALGAEEVGRYTVGSAHPNAVAFVVAMAIPPAWYLTTRTDHRVAVALLRSFPALAFVSIAATGSRSALLVGLLALGIVPWTMGWMRATERILMASVMIVGAVVVLQVTPDRPLERLATLGTEVQEGDLSGRIGIWEASGGIIADHALIGVGAGASRFAVDVQTGEEKGVHNTFLAVLADLGAVGLTVFGLLVLAVTYPIRRARPLERRLLTVMAVTLVAGLQPRHWVYEKVTWFFFAVLLGMAVASDRSTGGGERA